MDDPSSQVYAEIWAERVKQDAQWGGPAHDDTLNRHDWIKIIDRFRYRMIGSKTPERQRENFLQIAAVAVAAIESLDRKELNNPGG